MGNISRDRSEILVGGLFQNFFRVRAICPVDGFLLASLEKNATPATLQTFEGMQTCVLDLCVHCSTSSAGKSSLLIPALQEGYFKTKCAQFGSKSAYFAWMVRLYIPRVSEWQQQLNCRRDPNWNTIYQVPGCNLLKHNFMPHRQDWEFFRNAAAACGVSICFLFVFLMELEATGFFEKSPPTPHPGWITSSYKGYTENQFIKFSIYTRKLDRRRDRLHRKLKIQ